MTEILAITAPLYLCVLAGYVTTRWGPFRRSDMDVLGSFVMNVAMPAMVFASVSSRPLAEAIHPTFLAGYAVAALVMLGLGLLYSRRLERTRPAAAAFDALGMAGSNNGYVGFPLFSLVLPALAGPVLGMTVIVDSLVIIPLVLFVAELGSSHSLGRQFLGALRRVFTMPIMIALLLGLAASLVGLRLPAALATTLELFGRTTTALALFAVGGLLVGLTLRGNLRRILTVSAGKLLVMPAVAAGLVWALPRVGLPPLGPDLAKAVILTAALPSWTSSAVLAITYDERDVPPGVLLVTTAGSFLTLTGLLALLA